MDKERVIAIILTPIAIWLWEVLTAHLERRRDRKEAELAHYHSRSVVVSAPLRLGSDRGSREDGADRGGPAERPQH